MISLLIFTVQTSRQIDAINNKIKGDYNYCIEWEGFSGGTIHRDNLLYNCYSLSRQEFLCDYKILEDNRLMIKPIINITKNKKGEIVEITYGEPIYYNCTRWLKSSR